MHFRIDLGDLPGRVIFVLADRLAGRRPADRRGAWPPGAGAGVARCRGAFRARWSPERLLGTTEALVVLVAIDLIVGLFVGLQLAYLFGGLDTLDRRRHEVQRLRAARVLRARRSRRAGGRHPGRARIRGDPPKPPVRRPRDRPGRPDDRRPRVGGAPAPALPGRLRLDRAAPVRRRVDRGDGGHAGDARGVPGHRSDALARARDGRRSGSSR